MEYIHLLGNHLIQLEMLNSLTQLFMTASLKSQYKLVVSLLKIFSKLVVLLTNPDIEVWFKIYNHVVKLSSNLVAPFKLNQQCITNSACRFLFQAFTFLNALFSRLLLIPSSNALKPFLYDKNVAEIVEIIIKAKISQHEHLLPVLVFQDLLASIAHGIPLKPIHGTAIVLTRQYCNCLHPAITMVKMNDLVLLVNNADTTLGIILTLNFLVSSMRHLILHCPVNPTSCRQVLLSLQNLLLHNSELVRFSAVKSMFELFLMISKSSRTDCYALLMQPWHLFLVDTILAELSSCCFTKIATSHVIYLLMMSVLFSFFNSKKIASRFHQRHYQGFLRHLPLGKLDPSVRCIVRLLLLSLKEDTSFWILSKSLNEYEVSQETGPVDSFSFKDPSFKVPKLVDEVGSILLFPSLFDVQCDSRPADIEENSNIRISHFSILSRVFAMHRTSIGKIYQIDSCMSSKTSASVTSQ